ncbi:hypothetical protein BH09MYX1_BH09MYX1_68150 [soil metagenome]
MKSEDLLDEPGPWQSNAPSGVYTTRAGITERLSTYSILPPRAEHMSDDVLDGVEQVFVTCAELVDDDSRRRAIPLLFAGEAAMRDSLLAIVPIFYDELFFDERTPTRDLIELALIAHAKWRKQLQLA